MKRISTRNVAAVITALVLMSFCAAYFYRGNDFSKSIEMQMLLESSHIKVQWYGHLTTDIRNRGDILRLHDILCSSHFSFFADDIYEEMMWITIYDNNVKAIGALQIYTCKDDNISCFAMTNSGKVNRISRDVLEEFIGRVGAE